MFVSFLRHIVENGSDKVILPFSPSLDEKKPIVKEDMDYIFIYNSTKNRCIMIFASLATIVIKTKSFQKKISKPLVECATKTSLSAYFNYSYCN